MQFFSTRDTNRKVTSSEAIAQGLSDEGGLFVPESFPQVDVRALCELDYPALAAAVIREYLTDYSPEFLAQAARTPTVRLLAARRAILPRWKGTPMPWNCGMAPPAPSKITPCS